MPQIKLSRMSSSILLMLALIGCGDKNSQSVFNGDAHPTGWIVTHNTSAKEDVGSCKECHGEEYNSGISKVSCMSTNLSGFKCHITNPAENLTGCISCHGGPPSGPFGTSAPNTKSAHAKHMALSGVGCEVCHLNAGSGSENHAKAAANGGFRKATVAMPTFYKANIGSATFGYNTNNLTCANVSCHGGKPTPAWTGSINLVANDNSACRQCHTQRDLTGTTPPLYNDYYSGVYSGVNLHEFHLVTIGANCTDCHNIGTLTNYQKHFSGITTKTLTSPGQTIGGGAPTNIISYDMGTKTCTNSAAGCHPDLSLKWLEN